MTPIDMLLLWNWVVFNWTLDEWESCLCCCFAFASLRCARAVSLDFFSKTLVIGCVHFVGCAFLSCCCCFVSLLPCLRLLGPVIYCWCDGPGISSWRWWLLLLVFSGFISWFVGAVLGLLDCWVCLAYLVSVNRICFIFSWFLLYSWTVLHATKRFSFGFVSVTLAGSFFWLLCVFCCLFLSRMLLVSSLLLYIWCNFPDWFKCSTWFRCFACYVFSCNFFFVFMILVVVSLNNFISSSGVIFIGEMFLLLVACFFRFCSVEWSDEPYSDIPSWNVMSNSCS